MIDLLLDAQNINEFLALTGPDDVAVEGHFLFGLDFCPAVKIFLISIMKDDTLVPKNVSMTKQSIPFGDKLALKEKQFRSKLPK